MAGPRGDKVGDAWIKVTPIIDEKAVNQAESRAEKAARKARERMDRELGTQFQRQAEAQARLRRMIEEQNAGLRERQLREETRSQDRIRQVRDTSERRQHRNFERYLMLRIKMEQQAALAREKIDRKSAQVRAQIENSLERARVIRERISERNARRAGGGGGGRGPRNPFGGGGGFGGGPRRGSNNRGGPLGNSFRAITSILPGQLERLLDNPAVAAAAAAVGIELAGMIGGAAIAAIGALNLGAGIGLAISKDPKLQEAGKAIGTQLLSGLQDASLDQLQKPLRQAFDLLKGSNFIQGIVNDFEVGLGALAPHLVTFVSDVKTGIESITRAMRDLLTGTDGFIEPLGEGFKQISNAVASVFNELKDNAPGLKLLLGDLFATVSGIIRGLGKAIGFAADLRASLNRAAGGADVRTDRQKFFGNKDSGIVIDQFRKDVEERKRIIADLKAQGKDTSFTEKVLAGDEKILAEAIAVVSAEYNEQRGAALAVARANGTLSKSQSDLNAQIADSIKLQQEYDDTVNKSKNTKIAYEQAIDDLTESFKENGKTLDITKQKGRDNYKATEDAIRAAKDEALAIYEKTGSLDAAKKAYDKLVKPIQDNVGNTKANRKAVNDLKTAYGDFSKLPNIEKKIKVKLTNFDAVAASLRRLTGNKTITVDVARRVVEKNRANGGPIYGPGTGTSDSIPANLSNGEFVIKADSAKKIGMSNLSAMNATGEIPQGFASGGSVRPRVRGQGRGKTRSQLVQFDLLQKQIKALATTINKFTDVMGDVTEKLDSFVSLASVDAEGKSAGDIIQQLIQRRSKAKSFETSIKSLKKKGLSEEALKQIIAAGPDSPLAKTLAGGLGAIDIPQINALLGGDSAAGSRIATSLYGSQTKNKASLAAKKKKAAKLKPPRARGATISYAGGKTTALFSKKELVDQQLRAGTYVTVMIDGKEVRAIVKQEQTKAQSKANSKLRSGRR